MFFPPMLYAHVQEDIINTAIAIIAQVTRAIDYFLP
jgi:hypothetical protein